MHSTLTAEVASLLSRAYFVMRMCDVEELYVIHLLHLAEILLIHVQFPIHIHIHQRSDAMLNTNHMHTSLDLPIQRSRRTFFHACGFVKQLVSLAHNITTIPFSSCQTSIDLFRAQKTLGQINCHRLVYRENREQMDCCAIVLGENPQ
jgi:hypothetical protein